MAVCVGGDSLTDADTLVDVDGVADMDHDADKLALAVTDGVCVGGGVRERVEDDVMLADDDTDVLTEIDAERPERVLVTVADGVNGNVFVGGGVGVLLNDAVAVVEADVLGESLPDGETHIVVVDDPTVTLTSVLDDDTLNDRDGETMSDDVSIEIAVPLSDDDASLLVHVPLLAVLEVENERVLGGITRLDCVSDRDVDLEGDAERVREGRTDAERVSNTETDRDSLSVDEKVPPVSLCDRDQE